MSETDLIEQWIEESLRQSALRGFVPMVFIQMRRTHGTVGAMKRLVASPHINEGLKRLTELRMADEWSVEAGILKFPDRFTKAEFEAAQFRLNWAKSNDGA